MNRTHRTPLSFRPLRQLQASSTVHALQIALLSGLVAAFGLTGCDKEGGHSDEKAAGAAARREAANDKTNKEEAGKEEAGKEEAGKEEAGKEGAGKEGAGTAGAKGEGGAEAKAAKAEDKPKVEAKPAVPVISARERRTAPSNVAKAPAGAKKTSKGIPYKVLTEGTGKIKPQRDDTLTVRYTAWDTTGKATSTTWKVKSQEPRTIVVRKAIAGWADALQEMVVGERRLLWIPAKLAHVSKGKKKGSRTVDLELLAIQVAPKAPSDVRRPSEGAKRTKSGLRYKQITAGTGTKHPLAASNVKVRYAGWKPTGVCFDHTPEGETTEFNLTNVIKGWTEGLQLMVEGEKVRFWIPEKLAYDGMPGKPGGTLTFDVELVKIL